MDQQTETRPAAASAEVDWTCPGALVTIEDLAERHKSSKRTKERDIQQGNLCARDPRILEVDQISMARGCRSFAAVGRRSVDPALRQCVAAATR